MTKILKILVVVCMLLFTLQGAFAFTATGGTITSSGGYTIHTFTANGTFNITGGSGTFDVLMVAGGGGGGGSLGGGGGGGGYIYNASLNLSSMNYTVVVGAGGLGGNFSIYANGSNGQNTAFNGTQAIGGGGGGAYASSGVGSVGKNGGSGGGGSGDNTADKSGGSGTTGQGFNGGAGVGINAPPYWRAGGGGGGTSAGSNYNATDGGRGGSGYNSSLSGSTVTYSCGGGGGVYTGNNPGVGGCTNAGTGGVGTSGSGVATNGTANTGGGGGGAAYFQSSGNGGSGIVIIRYLASAASLTLQVNNTRTGSLVSGFSWNYTTNNASDANAKTGYCAATGCSITNYTGTLNITAFNVSGGNYFTPYDSPKLSFIYNASQTSYIFQTFSNSITLNVTNTVNQSTINSFCGMVNSSISSCTSSGSITLYGVIGTQTITWFNISDSTYFNQSLVITNYNSTSTAYQANTSQAILNITATQLYTLSSIALFNTTNYYVFNTTTNGNLLLLANNGSNNILVGVLGNYSKNITCTITAPLSTQSCVATGIYDDSFTIGAKTIGGTSINNFSVDVTNTSGSIIVSGNTTNGSIKFPVLQGNQYTFYMYAPNYAYANSTQLANASTNLYNFSLYTRNTVNFTFYYEANNSVVYGPSITLELIGSLQSANYTTTTGNITTNIISPDSYLVRYSATNYSTRFYEFTLVNNTYQSIRLPMLLSASSTSVTITVTDNVAHTIEDAIVRVYKYTLATNTYEINQIFTTNSEGVGVATIQLNSEYYYFTVEIDGVIRLATTPSYIYGTDIQLVVSSADPAFTTLFDSNNLVGTISNSTPTYFTFTYTDADNIASQGCLEVYTLGTSSMTFVSSTCVASSGGSVSYNITNTNSTYYLYGVVTKNNADIIAATRIVDYGTPPPTENTSRMWLFVMLIIMVVLVMMFRDTPAVAVLLAGAIPLLFSIPHLVAFGIGFTIPLFLVAVIIAVLIGL